MMPWVPGSQTLVVTKVGHADPDLARLGAVTILESAHPYPDERSLAAGAELEQRLARLDAGLQPIFLISGGSSSLVESLQEGVTLAALRELNERGFASGLDITELNAGRARLSRLKGGGVARMLGGRQATALFISDVPGDNPSVIGSGLLGPDGRRQDGIRRVVVANIDLALATVVDGARARGLVFERGDMRFEGDVDNIAREFVEALRHSSADGLVWGGESTVKLPARHGRGGRNTHLALRVARLLRAADTLTVLAAGTDGTDGATTDAGAMVDAETVDRAELAGCDVARALREFDSGSALEAAGDLLYTGPTGTNVGDILIGIRRELASRGPWPAHML